MSFVAGRLDSLAFTAANHFQEFEILQTGNRTFTENLIMLFGNSRVAVGKIHQVGNGAIGKGNHRRNIVTVVTTAIRKGDCRNRANGESHHVACPIDEMAEFSDDSSAFNSLLGPMAEWEEPCIDTHVNHHGFLPMSEEPTDLFCGRSEPAVE